MKIGAEDRTKVVLLSVLAAGCVYAVYANFFAGSSETTPAPAAASAPEPSAATSHTAEAPVSRPTRPRGSNVNKSGEFHPVLHANGDEKQVDPLSVDPTLRLDLLAKLLSVPAAGEGRNLFSMSAPPVKLAGLEPKIVPSHPSVGPPPLPPPPPPPGPAPLPPINFRYYGLATVRKDGRKAAFFLDGENIFIKTEGEMVEGGYKLVRIEAGRALVEDTKSKRQTEVQLAEEAQA